MKKYLLHLVILLTVFSAFRLNAQEGKYYVVFTGLDDIANTVTNYFSLLYYPPIATDVLTKDYATTAVFSSATFQAKPITEYDVAIFPIGTHKLDDVVGGVRIWDKVKEMLDADKGALVIGSNYMLEAIGSSNDMGTFLKTTVGLSTRNVESLGSNPYKAVRILGIEGDPVAQGFRLYGNTIYTENGITAGPVSYYNGIETFSIGSEYENATHGIQYVDSIGFGNATQITKDGDTAWVAVRWSDGPKKLVLWSYNYSIINLGNDNTEVNNGIRYAVRWYQQDVPRPEGYLVATPTQLNYDKVNLGGKATKSISIKNFSRVSVKIKSISVEDDENGAFALVSGGGATTLAPGDSVSVSISFQPGEPREYVDYLDIVSDAKNTPTVSVTLSGKGGDNVQEGPYIQVTALPIDFGNVLVGSVGIKSVTVANIGDMDLVIDSVKFVENASGLFDWDGVLKVPVVIKSKKSYDFKVRYTPSDQKLGKHTAKIRFNSSGHNNNGVATVDLIATGVADGAKGVIALSVDTLNFGKVQSGGESSIDKKFTIRNTGDAPLLVSQVVFDGDNENKAQFSFVDGSNVVDGGKINPGLSWDVTVRFTPLEALDYGLNIKIASNDIKTPVDILPVVGSGIEPLKGLKADVTALDFGPAPKWSTRNVVITNTSTNKITVSDITFKDGVDGVFKLLDENQKSFALNAGAQQTITIQFLPTETVAYSSKMVIKSDDENNPELVIPVTAFATSSVRFEQDLKGVFQMGANPNPAIDGTSLTYTLFGNNAKSANIYVVDMLGNKVSEIFNGSLLPGTYKISVDTRDMTAGAYFILAEIGDQGAYQALSIVK